MYRKNIGVWVEKVSDINLKSELNSLLSDEHECKERFYKYLGFGTGGLRGILGVGTNRMNIYTVTKATCGLAMYLLDKYSDRSKEKGVVIAYDSRNFSREFAENTAMCLNSFGIKTYIFKNITPTPMLSFAVNHLKCVAGVVITASHNPAKYNGYKVYDDTGCQITQAAADKISSFIRLSDEFYRYSDVKDFNGLYNVIDEDVNSAFYNEVLKYSVNKNDEEKRSLKLVYTAIHGSGNIPVRKVLALDGFHVETVKEQENPDGNFTTVKYPNPEERDALSMAIEKAVKIDADIAFGTDPDCDRIGVAVKNNGEYTLLTGNQIGALIIDYMINAQKKENVSLENRMVVKTIVTNELGANIAKNNGIKVEEVLTGFKYIGEKIAEYSADKSKEFLFGYEESFGFLIGTYAKDKDAVGASMLLCEMAAEYKAKNITLVDRLNQLYSDFGYYLDALDYFVLEGIDGENKIKLIMNDIRCNINELFDDVDYVNDYSEGIMGLPKSNVIKIFFKNGSWLAARPSGTEPKIKFYYSIKSDSLCSAQNTLDHLREIVKKEVNK